MNFEIEARAVQKRYNEYTYSNSFEMIKSINELYNKISKYSTFNLRPITYRSKEPFRVSVSFWDKNYLSNPHCNIYTIFFKQIRLLKDEKEFERQKAEFIELMHQMGFKV